VSLKNGAGLIPRGNIWPVRKRRDEEGGPPSNQEDDGINGDIHRRSAADVDETE